MTNKMIIYVDLDDVIALYTPAHKKYLKDHPEIEFPQAVRGFFTNLEPLPGAIEAVNRLRENPSIELYILTAPSVQNPRCYMEKREWVEKLFDLDLCRNLIICRNKGLLKGDFLIDDYSEGRGQELFEGELIHFATERYPTWREVMQYLIKEVCSTQ